MDEPGINERIFDILSSAGMPPLKVFTQSPGSESSGRYKGAVLYNIAAQDSVEQVHFLDDNSVYIKDAKHYIEEMDKINNTNAASKISIYKVDSSKKPGGQVGDFFGMISIANLLDSKQLFKEADKVDALLEIMVENAKKSKGN